MGDWLDLGLLSRFLRSGGPPIEINGTAGARFRERQEKRSAAIVSRSSSTSAALSASVRSAGIAALNRPAGIPPIHNGSGKRDFARLAAVDSARSNGTLSVALRRCCMTPSLRGLSVKRSGPPSRRGVAVVIKNMLDERRSLEEALTDLIATYQRDPHPALARSIELIQAEIKLRVRPSPPGAVG